MILHLGVIDVPYGNGPATKPTTAARKRRRAKQRAKAGGTAAVTTGDVAEILEGRYHVMEIFYETHQKEILGELEGALQGSLESLMMGQNPQGVDIYASAMTKIEDQFKQFLSTKEIEGLGIPGVPTDAALRGVSHRFAHPYARRAPRPSFIDTGLYQASFKSWID